MKFKTLIEPFGEELSNYKNVNSFNCKIECFDTDFLNKKLSILCAVESLHSFIYSPIYLKEKTTYKQISFEKEISNFADYLEFLPESVRIYPPFFTLVIQVIDENDGWDVLSEEQMLIANPWHDETVENSLKYDGTTISSEASLDYKIVIDFFIEAAKICFGNSVNCSINDYGPQVNIDDIGVSPFLNFSDDFIVVKYPISNVSSLEQKIKENPKKLRGFFIEELDYNYLVRFLSIGECNTNTFLNTFDIMRSLTSLK